MLSIAQCRKILGDAATSLSDEQIRRQRDTLYGFADIILDHYLREAASSPGSQRSHDNKEKLDVRSESGMLKRHLS